MDEARRDRILPEAMKPADDVGSFTRSAGHDLIGQTFGQLVIVAFAGSGRGKQTDRQSRLERKTAAGRSWRELLRSLLAGVAAHRRPPLIVHRRATNAAHLLAAIAAGPAPAWRLTFLAKLGRFHSLFTQNRRRKKHE
jgi:hypothetical protein